MHEPDWAGIEKWYIPAILEWRETELRGKKKRELQIYLVLCFFIRSYSALVFRVVRSMLIENRYRYKRSWE